MYVSCSRRLKPVDYNVLRECYLTDVAREKQFIAICIEKYDVINLWTQSQNPGDFVTPQF